VLNWELQDVTVGNGVEWMLWALDQYEDGESVSSWRFLFFSYQRFLGCDW